MYIYIYSYTHTSTAYEADSSRILPHLLISGVGPRRRQHSSPIPPACRPLACSPGNFQFDARRFSKLGNNKNRNLSQLGSSSWASLRNDTSSYQICHVLSEIFVAQVGEMGRDIAPSHPEKNGEKCHQLLWQHGNWCSLGTWFRSSSALASTSQEECGCVNTMM